MSNSLCISLRFLDPHYAFHGRGNGGEPEWPPSPLRAFQALVAASADRWRAQLFETKARPALEWLQRLGAPSIVAPPHHLGIPVRIAVPNNDLDVVATAWAEYRAPKRQPNELKTMKAVRPTRLEIEYDDQATVYYLFSVGDNGCPNLEVLCSAARSITHLGWGVDMVVGNASILSEDEIAKLPGERWQAVEEVSANGYRVPVEGTLNALQEKHRAFLSRIGPDGFIPVPSLSVFRVVGYRRATDSLTRQFAAFSILKPDTSGFRSFDATRRTRDVAGMVRHAVADAASRHGWPEEQINVFVHGKTPDGGSPASGEISPDRFLYLPLATINPALGRVESIRRVVVAAPAHCRAQIEWVRRALAGEELKNEKGEVAALLTILPGSDWVLRQYVEKANTWSTVTPVILPGHDDRDQAKSGKLLRTAFEQAGYEKELMNQVELEWRPVGYRAGVDLASRYLPPENLGNRPRYHVWTRFPNAIAGPVVVGGGRFRGFGVFAKCDA